MKRTATMLLAISFFAIGPLSPPVQAEFFSNMGGEKPPPRSKEVSSAALRSIAMVIEAVAVLEIGDIETAKGNLKEASGMLRTAANDFISLTSNEASASKVNLQSLPKDDLDFLQFTAGELKMSLSDGATVADLLKLTGLSLETTANVVDRFSESPNPQTYRDVLVSITRLLHLGETVSLAMKT